MPRLHAKLPRIPMTTNICQRCGACCAIYKVLFPSEETDDHINGLVPLQDTVKIDACRSAMRGTECFNKRCVALAGTIGQNVLCKIYANRPSVCQNFRASWETGCSNPNCDRARASFGLQPFSEY